MHLCLVTPNVWHKSSMWQLLQLYRVSQMVVRW